MAVKAPAKHAAKVWALHVLRATALRHHAEMVHRAPRALKAKAMADVKVVARAVAGKNNVAIPVLTTGGMAKAVPHLAVRAQKAEAPAVAVKVAVKSVANTMATNCHATSIP